MPEQFTNETLNHILNDFRQAIQITIDNVEEIKNNIPKMSAAIEQPQGSISQTLTALEKKRN